MIPLYDDNYHDTTIWGCYAVIAICTLMMFLQTSMEPAGTDRFLDAFAMIPAQFFGETAGQTNFPEWITLFTSAFLHGDWLHLMGNMLFLWLFADNIEHAFGHMRFIAFYLLSCALTAYGYALINGHSALPLVGASGAVSAMMGAYLVLYPKANVTIFVSILLPNIEIRAFILMINWLMLDIAGFASADGDTSGIAYEAHIIGFAIGIILGRVLRQNTSSYDEIWEGLERVQHKIPRNSWERFEQREKERRKYRGF